MSKSTITLKAIIAPSTPVTPSEFIDRIWNDLSHRILTSRASADFDEILKFNFLRATKTEDIKVFFDVKSDIGNAVNMRLRILDSNGSSLGTVQDAFTAGDYEFHNLTCNIGTSSSFMYCTAVLEQKVASGDKGFIKNILGVQKN